MKKRNRWNAALSLIFLMSLSFFVFRNNMIEAEPNVNRFCGRPGCTSTSQMIEVCAMDFDFTGQEEHGYGFLGLQKCSYDAYKCTGALVCETCQAIEQYPDKHYCREIHFDCGKAASSVCMMDYTMSEFGIVN
jgi:hypothetical protein